MSFRDGLIPGVRALADELGLYDFLGVAPSSTEANASGDDAQLLDEAPATPPLATPAVGPLSTSVPSRRELTARGIAARRLRPYAEPPGTSTTAHVSRYRTTEFGNMMATHQAPREQDPDDEGPRTSKPVVTELAQLASQLKW